MNSRNDCSFLTLINDFHFLIARIFFESILIPFRSITKFRKSISSLWNSHFSDLSRKFLSFKHLKTVIT